MLGWGWMKITHPDLDRVLHNWQGPWPVENSRGRSALSAGGREISLVPEPRRAAARRGETSLSGMRLSPTSKTESKRNRSCSGAGIFTRAQRLGHMGSLEPMFSGAFVPRRSSFESLAAILIKRNRQWRCFERIHLMIFLHFATRGIRPRAKDRL
jgi:hypothetical protein